MDYKNGENYDQDNPKQDSACCPGGQKQQDVDQNCCCSPSQPVKKSRNFAFFKTIISLLIIFAAIGIAAHSILTNSDSTILAQSDNQPEQTGALENACCTPLKSLVSLNKVAADKDFVFILFGGEADESTIAKADRMIYQATKKLAEKEISTANFRMSPEDSDYKNMVDKLQLKKFPAVLAIGKGCGKVAVVEDITVENLLASYTKALKPGCNPRACGIKR